MNFHYEFPPGTVPDRNGSTGSPPIGGTGNGNGTIPAPDPDRAPMTTTTTTTTKETQ